MKAPRKSWFAGMQLLFLAGAVLSSSVQAQSITTPQPDIRPEEAEYEPYHPMVMGGGLFGMLLADQLEYRVQDGDDLFRWDVEGWYGGDFNRIWFKSEGEQAMQGRSRGNAEIHGYYSRLIAPYWDAQVGVRYDQLWGPGEDRDRIFGVVGLEGFAPLRFEVQPALFLSEDGDVSARLTASKDYRITQRIVAQPRFEVEYAVQHASQFGVGEGINDVELGFRLRYEVRREFAPYVGLNWESKHGETATLARDEGEAKVNLAVVAGIRWWF